MKLNNINPLNFQKRLVAKVKGEKEDSKEYKIYRLDKKDRNYITDVINDWQGGMFFMDVLDDLESNKDEYQIYVLEDNKKHCLSYAEISTKSPYFNQLLFIETKPSLSYKNKERKTKYAGETMLSFLLGLTKATSKDKHFEVPHVLSTSYSFYVDKCGFKNHEGKSKMLVYKPREEFDSLIEQNKNHTDSTIEILI